MCAQKGAGKARRNAGKFASIAFALVVVVFFVGSFFVDRMMLDRTYQRVETAAPNLLPTYEAFASGHPRTPVEFQMDGKTLRGFVYEAQDPRGFIVFRHGIFSQHNDYLALICAMVDRGWTVFAYDAIGCGISDGDSTIGMAQSPLDVAAAVDFVRDNNLNGDLPLMLWGHSWGGYGVAAAMDLVPDVAACVTMSGYNEPCEILFETAKNMVGPFAITQEATIWLNNFLTFGPDGDRTALDGINKTEAPVLIIHGTDDAVIAYDGASIIAQRNSVTNPGAEYLTIDEQGRNGHNSYFYSAKSAQYLADKRSELDALSVQYPQSIPDKELAAFEASFDVLCGNEADPELIGAIDGFLTRALGGNMSTGNENANGTQSYAGDSDESPISEATYGPLLSASFTNSGNSLGNRYELEATQNSDGQVLVTLRQAAMHSDPLFVQEYIAPGELMGEISAIVDEAGMKAWGNLPYSEIQALDAAIPALSLTFVDASEGADADDLLWLSYSLSRNLPEGGIDAVYEIHDLMLSYATDAYLLREYTQPAE